jgi:methylmalonyl-CoA epimerase
MKIDHIGIATRGIQDALTFYRDALGLDVTETEEVPEQKVRVAMLPIGESRIELLEATSEDSPISRFVEKRGPGIHHVAVRVDDIRVALANLRQHGVRLIDEVPKHGAGGCLVAFVHPSSTGGVLLELVQPPAAPGLDHRSSDVSDCIEKKLTG